MSAVDEKNGHEPSNNGHHHVQTPLGGLVPMQMVHHQQPVQPAQQPAQPASLPPEEEPFNRDVTNGSRRNSFEVGSLRDAIDADKMPPLGGQPDDEGDAFGFGRSRSPALNVARMPVEKDAEAYNMSHKRRGMAFVFNHMYFDPRLGLKQRNGTNADRDNLRATLMAMDFEVRVYNDLTYKVKCLILNFYSRVSI